MKEIMSQLEELIALRGEEPVLVAQGGTSNHDGMTLYRFPDGVEVIDTNGDLISEADDGFEEVKKMYFKGE